MTDLERRALLGDRRAQEECTRQGVVLRCPCCSGNARVRYTGNGSGPLGYTSNIYCRSHPGFIMCNKCGLSTRKMNRVCRALAKWNTRPAPPLGRCKDCANTTPCEDVINHKYVIVCTVYGCRVKEDGLCREFEPKGENQ